MLWKTNNPARAYLYSLHSGGSQDTMKRGLDVVANIVSEGADDIDSFDWAQLRAHHVAQIRACLGERYKPSTTNRYLIAVRNTMKQAMHMGLIDWQAYQQITTVRNLPNNNEVVGRFIEHEEFEALLATCGTREEPLDKRDYALLWLLYTTGLRRGEVVNLKVINYHPEEESLDITKSKHNQLRTVYLPTPTMEALNDWLEAAEIPDNRHLFQGVRRGGHIEIKKSGMTDQAIYNALKKRCEQAEIKEPLAPHDFRRTFISLMLDNNVDILTVSKIAGHFNIRDTARYDRRKEEPKRRAISIFEE